MPLVCGQHTCYIGCPGVTWSLNLGSLVELDNLEEVVDLSTVVSLFIMCRQR